MSWRTSMKMWRKSSLPVGAAGGPLSGRVDGIESR